MGEEPVRILSVVGARPNLMKLAPVHTALERVGFESILVHTGQHYDDNMSGVFFRQLGLPEPDHNLGAGSGTHTQQTARVMLALEPLVDRLSPALVIVVGDVNSTLAAALVATKMGVPVAHVEAGLRSFDRTMPEETNRLVTDAVSDYLFTTERSANDNLRREGIADARVFFVGNVMIDTLRRHWTHAAGLDVPARCGVDRGEYALVTLHRPSNVDDPTTLERLVDALDALQRRLPVVLPAHPRTRARLHTFGLMDRVEAMPDFALREPLGYLDFLCLMGHARLVLTDSGGIQEETTALGVPCLTLRENTERPVTITGGTNRLVGNDPERIADAVAEALRDGTRPGREDPPSADSVGAGGPASVPELWDGRAAERIAAVLEERLGP